MQCRWKISFRPIIWKTNWLHLAHSSQHEWSTVTRVDELGRAPGEGLVAIICHSWLKTTKHHWRLGSKERELCWWHVKALLEDTRDTVGQSFEMSILRYIANRENDYSCLGHVKSLLERSIVVLKKDVFILQTVFMGKVGSCQWRHDFRGPPKGPVFLAWSLSQGSTLSTFLSLHCSQGQGSSGISEVRAGPWGMGSMGGTHWERAFLEHCWKSQSPQMSTIETEHQLSFQWMCPWPQAWLQNLKDITPKML